MGVVPPGARLSLAYAERSWEDATAGGVVVGAVALAAPVVALAHSLRRNPVMPAIEVAVAYPYPFLDRSTTPGPPATLWILDGVMLASIAVLALRIRAAGRRGGDEWALDAWLPAAAWYYGVAESGTLGAVGAHAFTAALLFLDLRAPGRPGSRGRGLTGPGG